MRENETNLVKNACKALGVTQKQLAEEIGVAENTMSQWARGVVDTPKWAEKMFKLLETEKKYNTAKRIFCDQETN